MPFRLLELTSAPPSLPGPAATPLEVTKLGVAHDALLTLDTLPGSGHRVLLEVGLQGGADFLFPNGDDPEAASRLYPDKDTPRVLARLEDVPITPGSFLGLDVVAIPSGPSQVYIGAADFEEDARGGQYELEVTYHNGDLDTVTVFASVDIPGSQEIYGAEPPNPWAQLVVKSADAIPFSLEPSTAFWAQWTRGTDVVADVTLRAIGSPRPVDVSVVERPNRIAVDQAESRWPTAMYAQSLPYDAAPSDYPIERLATADPGAGTEAIRRGTFEHGRQFGPVLIWWSAYREEPGATHMLSDWVSYPAPESFGAGDNEAPATSVTGTTEALITLITVTTPDPDLPGWLSGHYARQVDHGDDWLDGRTGVLPVWVSAYMRSSAGIATATLRLVTGDIDGWSEVLTETASTSFVWVHVPAWLEVGLGPEDAPVPRLWGSSSDGGARCEVRDFVVSMRVTS